MELQTGTPIYVWNVVLACISASGMEHYFTVQLYTTLCHLGLRLICLDQSQLGILEVVPHH